MMQIIEIHNPAQYKDAQEYLNHVRQRIIEENRKTYEWLKIPTKDPLDAWAQFRSVHEVAYGKDYPREVRGSTRILLESLMRMGVLGETFEVASNAVIDGWFTIDFPPELVKFIDQIIQNERLKAGMQNEPSTETKH